MFKAMKGGVEERSLRESGRFRWDTCEKEGKEKKKERKKGEGIGYMVQRPRYPLLYS